MKNLWKRVALVVVTGGIAVALVALVVRHRNLPGKYENLGKGIDKKIRESKDSLDKATAHVQGVFEQIRNLKV